MRTALLLSLLLMASWAHAAVIQYDPVTLNVLGASDVEVPNPSVSTVVVAGLAKDITWPIPAGCTVGQMFWSRLTTPPAMGVRPDFAPLFFTTSSPLLPSCHFVRSWPELRSLVQQTVIDAVNARELVIALNELNTMTYITVCPAANVSAECVAARTKMANLNATSNTYPTAAQFDGFLGQIQDLRDDALAFKAARGW